MVDLELLQTVSYVIGAIGVFAAAIDYIINVRYNMKAREMELCQLFAADWTSEIGMERYGTVMAMQWKDYDDFMNKYGYSKPEMFAKWTSQLFAIETMGILLRSKVVSPEKLYFLGGYGGIRLWEKYRDIIKGRRGVAWGQDYMFNAEYLAQEMTKIKLKHDATFKDKLEEYLRTGKP